MGTGGGEAQGVADPPPKKKTTKASSELPDKNLTQSWCLPYQKLHILIYTYLFIISNMYLQLAHFSFLLLVIKKVWKKKIFAIILSQLFEEYL
jgi:hypothetical protein